MRRGQIVMSVLGALVGLAAAVLLYRNYGVQEVAYGPRGFVVTSDTQVRVEFEVDKDPARTALCTVRSRDRTGREVGIALVRIGPAADSRVVTSYDLATTARAATGEVTGCSLE